jgi:hypothetical protein
VATFYERLRKLIRAYPCRWMFSLRTPETEPRTGRGALRLAVASEGRAIR